MTINGIGLEVQQIAAADPATRKAPIVFLHEGLGSVSMWRDWPAQVCRASGRAGVVYSRQGYGQSDPVPDVRGPSSEQDGQRRGRLLPDYMHREAWEVLPALLRELRIESPVLLGHSDGGSVALLYASRYPVAACIVMAPHVMVEDICVQAIGQVRDTFDNGVLRERLTRHHADADGAFWQWCDVWSSQGFRSFDIREDCRRITAPVLAMQGVDDTYGTMAQIEEIAPTQGHFEMHKLPQCGHSPYRDQAEQSATLAIRFLQGQS
jgi:pimeloyl-ACP methyl ester carboxylesterase